MNSTIQSFGCDLARNYLAGSYSTCSTVDTTVPISGCFSVGFVDHAKGGLP